MISASHLTRRNAAVWVAELATEAMERTRPLYHSDLVTQLVLSTLYQSKELEMTPAMSAACTKQLAYLLMLENKSGRPVTLVVFILVISLSIYVLTI